MNLSKLFLNKVMFKRFRLYMPIIILALITGAMTLGPLLAEQVFAPGNRRN